MGYSKQNDSSEIFAVITPHDSTNLSSQPRAISVNTSGLVQLVRPDGTVVPVYVAAGVQFVCAPIRINATDTAATGITGFW